MAASDAQAGSAFFSQVAALPWRLNEDGDVVILLVTSRTNGKWMLPKGWRMPERSDAQAALQEAREEAGVDGVIFDRPIGSYRYLKMLADGSTVPSQALVYSLRVTADLDDWAERKWRQRRWVRPKKAAKMVFEPDLARFLANLAAGRIVLA